MRRAILALTVGGVLLTVACGTAKNPDSPVVPAVTVAAPPGQAENKAVCEALGHVYSQNMGPFAESVSKMVAGRQGADGAKTLQAQAQKTLSAFATGIRGATQASTDSQVRADGKRTADQLQAKSADDTFFSKVRTVEDADTLIGPTLKQWLAPVNKHCS